MRKKSQDKPATSTQPQDRKSVADRREEILEMLEPKLPPLTLSNCPNLRVMRRRCPSEEKV